MNVRTAESITRMTRKTPPANQSTFTTTSTEAQLRRLATRGQAEGGGDRSCVPTGAAWRRVGGRAPPSWAWWHAEDVRFAAHRRGAPAGGRGRSRGSVPGNAYRRPALAPPAPGARAA